VVHPIPETLLARPFHRSEALTLGLSPRVLEGPRFVRIHPRVYRHRDHVLTFEDVVSAARLALPADAHLTGCTRLRLLGLSVGPELPVRLVVARDLHLALDDIFLHRTVLLPPTDGDGVTPAAAYLAYCHRARVLDAIRAGDWLLHHAHMDGDELAALVSGEGWRDGAAEAAWVMDHLVGDSRSLLESEVRSLVTFAGLPPPEPNGRILLGEATVHGDLWFPGYRVAVEVEGAQHQVDRGQYLSDIDRYALYRRHAVCYVQVTREKLRSPRAVVREVHQCLVEGGYDGPGPVFGPTWDLLFARLAHVVPRFRRPLRAVS
jgi:hypothetical protein